MRELARCRCDTRAAADAIATSARSLGCDVEVRAAGSLGWIVIVESAVDARSAPRPQRGIAA
jgi:hypothetical protein